MKKKIVLGVIFPLCATALLGACNLRKQSGESVDSSKTQLYINNFARGFGTKWLDNLKTQFESEHAEDSYEDGKKGVQIIIHSSNSPIKDNLGNILTKDDEIYFTEQSSYFQLYDAGVLCDITSAVTEKLTGYSETKSIEDKLTEEQQDYFGIVKDGTRHYYGVPHYSGFFGLQIDVDLFDEKGFYFAATPLDEGNGRFVTSRNPVKSAGPDGISGTYDDGFPRTYDEFFALCDYMVEEGCTPIVGSGANTSDYINHLVNGFVADYEGKDQLMNKYRSKGTMVNLVSSINPDGSVTKEAPTTINNQNGYLAYKSAGNYYGLKFLERMLSKSSYYWDKIKSSSYSAKSAQDDFLISYSEKSKQQIGMIYEGSWWENESDTTSTSLAQQKGDTYSKMNRRFAFLPFPKPTMERYLESNKSTLFDHLFSIMFVKANAASWKMPLINEFVKFCNSDRSLRDFTVTTNTPKSLNYELTAEDKAKMTYYGKCLAELKANADVVYPGCSDEIFKVHSNEFLNDRQYFTKVDSTVTQYAWNGIYARNYTAEQYFGGMVTYYQEQWAKWN